MRTGWFIVQTHESKPKAMDFFGQQDRARNQSYLLLGIFAAVMVGYAVAIHTVIAFLVNIIPSGRLINGGSLRESETADRVVFILTASLCCLVLYGCWKRYQQIKDGGHFLARQFGATQIDSDVVSRADRQLLSVAGEMSAAASIVCPSIFCLRDEAAINAFVIGSGDDNALVVSQGALDNLEREELLGVVGHEFGHLVNGDLGFNMQLLAVLGGFNSLDEAGKKCVALAVRQRRSIASTREGISLAMLFVAAGGLLRVVGWLGVLAGNIVRSSFSRQREYLADASSVQFTRSTYGLAAALNKAEGSRAGPALHSRYKEELAHMCFHNPAQHFLFGQIFDTHPPIEKRIAAIDKHFTVKLRKRNDKSKRQSEAKEAAASGGGVVALGMINTLNTGFSENVVEAVQDSVSCHAILFALFVSADDCDSENDFCALRFAFTTEFSDKVKNIRNVMGEELDKNKLRIIELIMPTLVLSDSSTQQLLLGNIEKLIDSKSVKSIESFTALQFVRRKLGTREQQEQAKLDGTVPFPQAGPPGQGVKNRSISELGEELSLLLSLMVEASGHNSERTNDEYARVLKCYTAEHYPRRSVDDEGVMEELQRAFESLQQQPLAQRTAFVQHCSEIMQSDGISMAEEIALINLFAASLDVPELCVA